MFKRVEGLGRGYSSNVVSMYMCCDLEYLTSAEAVDSIEENGRTPLMYSAMADREDCLKLLLKKHAHVSARDNNGQTALHWAAISVSDIIIIHNVLGC